MFIGEFHVATGTKYKHIKHPSRLLMTKMSMTIDMEVTSDHLIKNYKQMKIEDLDPEMLEKAAGILKAIAHPLRIAILARLDEGEKLTVTEIHNILNIEQSTASHHLGILKDKGVLVSQRDGKNTYYSLRYESLKNIVDCVSKCSLK